MRHPQTSPVQAFHPHDYHGPVDDLASDSHAYYGICAGHDQNAAGVPDAASPFVFERLRGVAWQTTETKQALYRADGINGRPTWEADGIDDFYTMDFSAAPVTVGLTVCVFAFDSAPGAVAMVTDGISNAIRLRWNTASGDFEYRTNDTGGGTHSLGAASTGPHLVWILNTSPGVTVGIDSLTAASTKGLDQSVQGDGLTLFAANTTTSGFAAAHLALWAHWDDVESPADAGSWPSLIIPMIAGHYGITLS